MKSNNQLQKDIYQELKWDPSVSFEDIGVTVKDKAVVTLTGTVPFYSDKYAAEKAAQRVEGVKVVAEDIVVVPFGQHDLSDTAVGKSIVRALEYNNWVPSEVKVKVENGWVTLTGDVEWEYQKKAAKSSLVNLSGVRGVTNSIFIKPKIKAEDIRNKIKAALERLADIDAKNIKIEAKGNSVTLSGNVHSESERLEAKYAAWRAPGVIKVNNQLRVVD